MSLNIHVEAKPDSIRGLADWLKTLADRADGGSGQALSARRTSFGGWEGDAAEGFRAVAYRMFRDGDSLAESIHTVAYSMESHANDIQVVHERMDDARDIALKAGLACTDREIKEPGSPPPHPLSIPGLTDPDKSDELRAAWDSWTAWMDKAEAYTQCVIMATEARTIEQDSQSRAADQMDSQLDGTIITVTGFLTGLASAYVTRQQAWRAASTKLARAATKNLAAAGALEGVPGTARLQVRYWRAAAINTTRAQLAEIRANTNKIGRWLEKLPTPAKNALTANVGKILTGPHLSKAPAILKRIPGIGLALTAYAAKTEIDAGADPAFTVFKHGTGLMVGVGAGMLVGGPLGAVAGAVVSWGVTEIIDAAAPDPEDVMIIAPGADFPYPR